MNVCEDLLWVGNPFVWLLGVQNLNVRGRHRQLPISKEIPGNINKNS